ncbi:hypothetical protein [Spirosoma sp.]|uniref:hypothetical protein n=1 Tax=Spirosoma sp. TaxID=1899569 RepID=UPI002602016D|nr:hypothetical protein [Spirosoma sp.]MCX6216507.1 hypothetical protein [Spirosoma sp.]
MIAILNDSGQSLNLIPGLNLVTERAAAWLSDDDLPGEFSYAIDLPLNENNKRFVAHGYRPDLAQPFSEMPVTAQMSGVLYRRCTFSFRLNEGKLSGFLKIDSAEFYDRIRNLSLLEAFNTPLILGDGLLTGTDFRTRLKQIAALKPGEFPCTFFPIRNDGFWESDFGAEQLPGFAGGVFLGTDELSPVTYLNPWEKLEGGGVGFVVDQPSVPRYGRAICPQFYLAYVLEGIMKLAGYRIESDWLASAEVQAMTVLNLTAMNQKLPFAELPIGHKLTPGLFLPDVSVSEFLKAVKGRFGLVFTYDGNARVCHITQFVGTIRAGAAIDLTPYQAGPYSTDFSDGSGYSVRDFYDSGDALYKDADGKSIEAPAQVVGRGRTPVTLRAGTTQLVRVRSNLSADALWFVPTVYQPGNTLDPTYSASSRYLSKEGKRPNSVGIRFLSYRGMTTDSKGNSYPLASPDVYDGQQVARSSQALTMGGRAGSWRNYLRAYYYFRDQTQRVTQPLLMPVDVLASLQLHRMIWLTLEDQIRRSYLILKLRADSPNEDGKVTVRLEALTLPSGIEQVADPADPIVWVEFIFGPGTYLSNPIRQYAVLTVKTWVDAAKSAPALVTNLPINIRFQRSHLDTRGGTNGNDRLVDYLEYVKTYMANGSTTVLETAFLGQYIDPLDRNYRYYNYDFALDPGEGYKILGPRINL